MDGGSGRRSFHCQVALPTLKRPIQRSDKPASARDSSLGILSLLADKTAVMSGISPPSMLGQAFLEHWIWGSQFAWLRDRTLMCPDGSRPRLLSIMNELHFSATPAKGF